MHLIFEFKSILENINFKKLKMDLMTECVNEFSFDLFNTIYKNRVERNFSNKMIFFSSIFEYLLILSS